MVAPLGFEPRKRDPESRVLHAGMAGMQTNFRDFWNPIFAGGAGDYFDIANIHSISTTAETEDLFIVSFKDYLKKYGITDKPIWVTEAQYGNLQSKPANIKEFEQLMARSVVFALSQGADKIFLIENWIHWEIDVKGPNSQTGDKKDDGVDYQKDKLSGGDQKKEEIKKEALTTAVDTSTHKVYLNLVDKVNLFEKVETLNEKYHQNSSFGTGVSSEIGHYKFINGDKAIYVLWGESSTVEPEITGKVKVTDIYGITKIIDALSINITNSPIFVEIQ